MSNLLKWLFIIVMTVILIVAAAFMLPAAKPTQPSPVVAEQSAPEAHAVNPHEHMEALIKTWLDGAPIDGGKPVLTKEQVFFNELYDRAIDSPDVKFGVSPKDRPHNRVTDETLPFQVMAQRSFPNGWPRAIWIPQLKMRAIVIPMADECNVTLYDYGDHIEICFLSVRYEQYANVGFVKTKFDLTTPRNNRESINTAHRFVWEKVQEMNQIDAGMIDPDVSMAFDSSANRMHEKPGHLKQCDFRRQLEAFDRLYAQAPEFPQHLYSISTRSFFSALIHMPLSYPIQRLVKADGEAYLVMQVSGGKNVVFAKRRLTGINYVQVIEPEPGVAAGAFAPVRTRIASDKFVEGMAEPFLVMLAKVPPAPPVRPQTDFGEAI